jgi:hypothetical protein
LGQKNKTANFRDVDGGDAARKKAWQLLYINKSKEQKELDDRFTSNVKSMNKFSVLAQEAKQSFSASVRLWMFSFALPSSCASRCFSLVLVDEENRLHRTFALKQAGT